MDISKKVFRVKGQGHKNVCHQSRRFTIEDLVKKYSVIVIVNAMKCCTPIAYDM